MEFLKDLNVLEILKLGAIGLGFLLALMSYLLIRKEQEKENPNASFLSTARWFMVFSLCMMVLGIAAEFFKTKSSLNIRLGSNEISINELSYSSSGTLDTRAYFINSEQGFAFRKPNKNWTQVSVEKGMSGLFNIMQVKSKYITRESLNSRTTGNPLASLFDNVTLYYFENAESKTDISMTDSSGNDLINEMVKGRSEALLETGLDLSDPDDLADYREDLNEYRRALIGFDTMVAKEAFLLAVYPKDSLPGYMRRLKLPAFYTAYSIAQGLNTDKLVANEKQILAGTEVSLSHVRIRSTVSDFQTKKWMMFTESDRFFYVIEISYSPQISSSTDLWDNLQDAMNSFTLLVD